MPSSEGAGPGGIAPRVDYRARRERLAGWLGEQGLAAAVLADFEGLRNASLRYFTGHPMDALLVVEASGRALLVPWDVRLAERRAQVERVQPYLRFGRSLPRAIRELLSEPELAGEARDWRRGVSRPRVELSGSLPYPLVNELEQDLPGVRLLCRGSGGLDEFAAGLRAIKDAGELEALRQACRLTDELAREVEGRLAAGWRPSETELALFLEAQARERGAEGMAFETLAAGPERSFAIHAFPPYTAAAFGAPGFSILDFGVCWAGYRSDVTLTAARGPLSPLQERMREAVLAAYTRALPQVMPGADPQEIGADIDRFLDEAGLPMPHGLGHGLGLEAHEAPSLRLRQPDAPAAPPPAALRAGMVLTIEPGAYDPEAGGVRLENDLLVTAGGHELLTHARLFQLGG
jgi:Xaa-Pro dipeptidase